jgi:hypothetical protein
MLHYWSDMEQVKNALFDISTCMQGLLAYQDAKWTSDEISSLSTRKLQGWVIDKGYKIAVHVLLN